MAYRATFSTGSLTTYLTVVNMLVFEGAASEWSHVTSGVPQGSVLGPLLFLLFINDFPNVIPESTSTGLYVDDTKLCKAIRSRVDCAQLQEALTCADDWSRECNINFNPSKCKILKYAHQEHCSQGEWNAGMSLGGHVPG